jgi:hypothetical protein
VNVEPEIYDYTSYNWSHWNNNKKLKEESGSYTLARLLKAKTYALGTIFLNW